MRTALRLLLGALLAILAGYPVSGRAAADSSNYQGLWWNAPPGSEPGWGISIAQQGDAMLATWATYDDGGNPLWLFVAAKRAGEATFAGDIVVAAGPLMGSIPFDPPWVSRQVIGSGTLSFADEDNGTFSYEVNGARRAKLITRMAFAAPPACTYEADPELVNADNYTDLWWVAGGRESSWRIGLAHQGDVIFASWFAYDAVNMPRWWTATARRVGPAVYSGPLVRTTGPAFGAQPYDPSRVARSEVGTASFTFAHGNWATFSYTMEDLTGTKAITRQLLAPPAGTRCREAAGETIHGQVFEGAPVQAVVCADADGDARCGPDEARASTEVDGHYALAVPAGYHGALAAEIGGGKYRMASPSADYSANITPYSTLVQLTRERDFSLAEAMVRNELGLPPRFAIRLDAPADDGSLARAVARSLVTAFEATATADYRAPDALGRLLAAFPPALTEMPQLRIATKDAAPVVSKEVYLDAIYTLTNPAASRPAATFTGKIRGRGNYTWTLPKKPFKVQLANDGAYAAEPDVLGMKKNRNWALLADYADRTLMRNQLMLTLGNSRLFSDGLKWTPSGVHVEVWLNGEYQGVYLLTEDIRLDPARLDLRKMTSADFDGGYIAEIDFPLDCYNDGVVSLQHVTPQGVHVCIKTPDETSATAGQLAYIKGLIDAAERDIYENTRIDRINPVSFADWYLLQELYRNYDAPFYSSDYLWKDSAAAAVPADRLLNMGPLWDFDIAAGNLEIADAWQTRGCWVTRIRAEMPNWYAKIFDNRAMVELTLARWQEKRPALEKLVTSSIAAFARRLGEAQQRNFARWPMLDTRGYIIGYQTYQEHVAFLETYLVQRMRWLDEAYQSPSQFETMCK